MNLPRAAASADFSHSSSSGVHAPDHAGVDGDQGKMLRLDLEKRSILQRGRHAVFFSKPVRLGMSSSMRSSVVLVRCRSASTRACIAARAAVGVRNVALKPSSASYQS